MNSRAFILPAVLVVAFCHGCDNDKKATCAFDPWASPVWDVDTIAVAQEVTVNGIWGVSRNEIYAVGMVDSGQGKTGVVWKSDGATWGTTYTRVNADLRDIHGTSSGDIWIAGMDNPSDIPSGYPGESLVLHWDGSSWQESFVDPSLPGLFAVWSDGEDAYACGRRGTFLHFDGASWSQEAVVAEYPAVSAYWDLNDVWGIGTRANRELYVATTQGGAAVILHKQDGIWGTALVTVSGQGQSRFLGVWARDKREVYGLNLWSPGLWGANSLYLGADTTWTRLKVMTRNNITYSSIRGSVDGDVFAVSRLVARLEGDELVPYTDFPGYGSILNDLWVDGHDVYAAGNNGGLGIVLFGDLGGACKP